MVLNLKMTEVKSPNEHLIEDYFEEDVLGVKDLVIDIDEVGYDFLMDLERCVARGTAKLLNRFNVGVISDSADQNRFEDLTIYTYEDTKYVYVVQELRQLSGGEYGNWGGGVLHHAAVTIHHKGITKKSPTGC